MAAGDLKGEEAIVIEVPVTGDEVPVKGDVMHWEAANDWRIGALKDYGPKGVAIDVSANSLIKMVIWGRVEVTADDTTIDKGQRVIAGAAGDASANTLSDPSQNLGRAMEDFAADGNGTIWVGLM